MQEHSNGNGFAPVDIRTTFETETSGEGVHPIKYEVSAMRETVARCVVAMGVGFALMVAQGCKKQAAPAPVQPVVRAAQMQPDFAVGPLPVEDVDPGAIPRVDRTARRRQYVQPVQVQVQSADAQAAVAAAQRRQDARLLQQQQADSQRQQQELDQDIEENLKTQQEMEAEPRIQDIPEAPLTTPPPPTPTQPQWQ